MEENSKGKEMIRKILALVIVLSFGVAQAQKMKMPMPMPATPTIKNHNDQDQSQEQGQEQQQDQDQNQNQSQEANNSFESNETTEQNLSISNQRQAAGNDAPTVLASGVCSRSITGGISLLKGNASLGRTYTDEECNMRETARLLYIFGERDMAIQLLCMTPAAGNLGSCAPAQDYHYEMKSLQAQNEMAVNDAARMEEQTERLRKEMDEMKEELKERDRRIHEAGQIGKKVYKE